MTDSMIGRYKKKLKVGDIVYITHALTEEEACEIDREIGTRVPDRYWIRDMDKLIGRVCKISNFGNMWNPILLRPIGSGYVETCRYLFPPQTLAKCSITLE